MMATKTPSRSWWLAAVSTSVSFASEVAEFDHSILPDDCRVYTFTLAEPRMVDIAASGGAELRAVLRNNNGNEIVSFLGDGIFSLEEFSRPEITSGDFQETWNGACPRLPPRDRREQTRHDKT